jgi:hypothetical protein
MLLLGTLRAPRLCEKEWGDEKMPGPISRRVAGHLEFSSAMERLREAAWQQHGQMR